MRAHRKTFYLLAAAVACTHGVARAQDVSLCTRLGGSALVGAEADYRRTLEDIGTINIQPNVTRLSTPAACTADKGLWSRTSGDIAYNNKLFDIAPVTLQNTFNSAYPVDRNNGAMWAGRGLSTAITAGVTIQTKYIKAAIVPQAIFEQNADFDLADTARSHRAPLAYPWVTIDLPQRFGYKSITRITPGQSYIRADYKKFDAGVSTENVWWGPGRTQALIMSNTAEGFPHAFIGTNTPVNIGIGTLFVEGMWGRLTESEYFDTIPSNDHSLFTGVTLEYVPKWMPGFSVGLHRVYEYANAGSVPFKDYVLPLFAKPLKVSLATTGNPFGESGDNQLASIYARYVLPESGAEAYFEWAKDDHNWDFWDLIGEPDHTQAYILGFQKVFKSETRYVTLNTELSHLEASTSERSGRGFTRFYVHSVVTQGYTNRGQLLGSFIGPGSDSFIMSADVYHPWGRVGGYIERITHDNDAYFINFALPPLNYEFNGHDAEVGAGARASVQRNHFFFDGRVGLDVRRNRSFIGLDGVNFDFRKDYNLSADLGVTWQH